MKFSVAKSVIFDEAKLVKRISRPEGAQPKAPSETDEVVRPELFSKTEWPSKAVVIEKKAARKTLTPAKATNNKDSKLAVSFTDNMSPPPGKLDKRARGNTQN